MAVRKREYVEADTGKAVWGYDFSYLRQRYRDSGFKSKREAEMAEDKARNEVIIQGRPLAPRQTGTLDVLAPNFFESRSREMSNNTSSKEKRRYPAISALMGSKKLHLITAADIHAFVQHRLKQEVCHRTINLDLSLLRNLFDYAMLHNYAVRNPAKEIKNLKEAKHKKLIPTDAEFNRYMEEIRKLRNGRIVEVYIMTRCFTAIRPSEGYFLEWDRDIDFERDKIYIRSKEGSPLKTGEDREIDMHPELKKILLAWREEWLKVMEEAKPKFDDPKNQVPVHDWVFFNPRNPTKRVQEFKRVIEDARETARLPWLNSYTFRHYGISKMLMAGIDRFTIQQWTGHKSSKMFDEVYGHLQPEHGARQMAKLHLPVQSASATQPTQDLPAEDAAPIVAPIAFPVAPADGKRAVS